MITNQFLYKSYEQLYSKLSVIDEKTVCLIQIFTNALLPEEAVKLAQEIQILCPNAKIIGSSVSGIIYQGDQYDNETLIVVEKYNEAIPSTHMIEIENKSYEAISTEICNSLEDTIPSLMRLFIGAYYDYAHQLMEKMNELEPNLKIVGGMSGELHSFPNITPYVFNHEKSLANGLVFSTLVSERLKVYGRINTAHEAIGPTYTITDVKDKLILSIENTPAEEWLQHNFGVLSTKQYKTWEEIAQNDPLVRLQLALENHSRSIRFIHYDEANDEITQYFSRLPAGTKFKISYTSPSKCAEESIDTCREVASTPIENLFCYSCLFRKLYLKNCAKWELSPYHKNPVNGVFLLGEFGYSEEGNTLLNGSCVLSGLAENEHYLSVDMSKLDALEDIRDEDEKLMDFIIRKQSEPTSSAHQRILDEMIAHETNHITNPFQRIDIGTAISDLSKYETEKVDLNLNKLCMVKIENADVLISQNGQFEYFNHLKFILETLKEKSFEKDILSNLHIYSIKSDTYLIACNKSIDRYSFSNFIHKLQERCDTIQKMRADMPLLLRFALVRNHPFILERAIALMESHRNSQLHIIIDDLYNEGEFTPLVSNSVDELSYIKLIQSAIENDQVIPYYQGLYNNTTNKIDKYEALMRIADSNGIIYSPYHFMEISKKYRLYLDLNLKMFQRVLRDFSQIDCGVSINLSVHDILSPRFRKIMVEELNNFKNPSKITFELLEDECIANMEGIKNFISEVRSYGVKVAIDDFGSGYSNLLEIMKIRPDYIKIDGQIIGNINKYDENESILEAISLLAKRLSIQLVAEYVENAAIQERMIAHGVYYSQGYYFSKPQPFPDILNTYQNVVETTKPLVEATDILLETNNHTKISNSDEHNLFKAIQSLSSDLLFSLNLSTKQMRHFGKAKDEMGIPEIIENFPQSAFDHGLVASEDFENVLESIRCMRQGIEQPGFFRINNKDGIANWYRMDYKLVLDYRGVPNESIGKLTNIQHQKDLEDKINIDATTGCLRKGVFETLTTSYLSKHPEQQSTLFIIDLDNFKAVNDNLGHQFGDRVLRGVGDKLHAIFHERDFIGRIGGDEFMVLIIGENNIDTIKKKAKEILLALDTTYKGSTSSYRISASVGIALFPQHANDFQNLYDHADIALFSAKNHGKNSYTIYHDTLSKGTMENTLPFDIATRTLAQHYDSMVVKEVFDLLFETKEFDISIQTVLELIGKRFDVSRCYIFEQHPNMLDTYQNTYEWCNQGVTSEKENLDAVPLSLFQDFYNHANEEGVLYCNDISQIKREDSRHMIQSQGIKSFLHAYTSTEYGISYLIGIDEVTSPRVWTPIEVSTIMQVSKIIAQFLSYKKTVHDLETFTNERLSILDSLDYFAYIIDRHTYELTYFNNYLSLSEINIELGQPCYKAIRKKNKPCKNCPLKTMEKLGLSSIRSLIYDSNLCSNLLTMSTFQPSINGRETACVTAISLDDIYELKVEKKIV